VTLAFRGKAGAGGRVWARRLPAGYGETRFSGYAVAVATVSLLSIAVLLPMAFLPVAPMASLFLAIAFLLVLR